MKYYFQIQFRRLVRHLKDFGIDPILGISLLTVVFFSLSWLLFDRIPNYASPIYLVFAVHTLLSISNAKNKEFLKLAFSKKEFLKVRFFENLFVCAPFILFFTFQFEPLYAAALMIPIVGFSSIRVNKNINYSFRTPFSNYPFEFSRGFRKSILIYPVAYGLTIIGMAVGNMNLAIAAILLIGLSSAHYYSFVEPDYYVWVYREGARRVILEKIKRGIFHLVLCIAPILFVTIFSFPKEIIYQLGCVVLMALFLIANMILKYAHFPRNIEMIQAILLPLLFLFPPLLLLIIPYYYNKAVKQINPLTGR